MRHFIDISMVEPENLRFMLDEAKRIKAARAPLKTRGTVDLQPLLADHTLGMIFEQPSTRTRLSFDMGIRQMGGDSVVLNGQEMQLGRGESIADTARILSYFVDVIMLRSNDHQKIIELAQTASVPVINGLTPHSHPCQIMADIMTMEETFGNVEGLTVSWVGDGNNVANSFIEAAAQFKFKLRIAHPDGYAPDTDVVLWARGQGADICFFDTALAAVCGSDVVITDTWVSMSDNEDDDRFASFLPFQVNDELMSNAADHAIFMHCLPAHRGEEVTSSVMDGPKSIVWREAENRLHVQKSILAWVLGAI